MSFFLQCETPGWDQQRTSYKHVMESSDAAVRSGSVGGEI